MWLLYLLPFLIMIVSSVWLVWKAMHAPEGWEDESGFHYKRQGKGR